MLFHRKVIHVLLTSTGSNCKVNSVVSHQDSSLAVDFPSQGVLITQEHSPSIRTTQTESKCLADVLSLWTLEHILQTNVMIYHCGASEWAEHWLTNLSLHKAGFVMHKYISRYHISQQPGQLLSVWLHMHELSFTQKSWAEFLTFVSAVHAWPLPEATSTTVEIKICTVCGQLAIDEL